MLEERNTTSEIAGYISTLLRKHYGKGPTSVYATIKRPYVVIHFKGFLNPMEKILLKQQEWKRVLETRDLLLQELKPQILAELLTLTDLDFTELYADWNLSSQTGIFIGIVNEKTAPENLKWPKELDREAFHEKIETLSDSNERKPDQVESVWLSNRTLLVKRSEVLIGIEKALIKEGYGEVLKLVKRPVEQELLKESGLDKELHRKISEFFMDWDFDQNVGYLVIVLVPSRAN